MATAVQTVNQHSHTAGDASLQLLPIATHSNIAVLQPISQPPSISSFSSSFGRGRAKPKIEPIKKHLRGRFWTYLDKLMRHLERDEPSLHAKAKKIVNDGFARYYRKEADYTRPSIPMKKRLREAFGETDWKRLERQIQATTTTTTTTAMSCTIGGMQSLKSERIASTKSDSTGQHQQLRTSKEDADAAIASIVAAHKGTTGITFALSSFNPTPISAIVARDIQRTEEASVATRAAIAAATISTSVLLSPDGSEFIQTRPINEDSVLQTIREQQQQLKESISEAISVGTSKRDSPSEAPFSSSSSTATFIKKMRRRDESARAATMANAIESADCSWCVVNETRMA